MYTFMETAMAPARPDHATSSKATCNHAAISARALSRMLDVVGYGMLLVVDGPMAVYANQVARAELDDAHPLQLRGRNLLARNPSDVAPLLKALSGATCRGAQSMVTLHGMRGDTVSVSIVPLIDLDEPPAALLVFGKRRVCDELSTDAFARQHDLTLAETRVLQRLCAGHPPGDIARNLGVKLTTVRTQISMIRVKTGSPNINSIVHLVSRLPPLPALLRRGPDRSDLAAAEGRQTLGPSRILLCVPWHPVCARSHATSRQRPESRWATLTATHGR